jgi:hypothetical protein
MEPGAIQSKYFVIGNKPLTTWQEIVFENWPDQTVYDWYVNLPDWFNHHSGLRLIKFYGSSIDQFNQKVVLYNGEHTESFNPVQQVSIHSNIDLFVNNNSAVNDFNEKSDYPYTHNVNNEKWTAGRVITSGVGGTQRIAILYDSYGDTQTPIPEGYTGGSIWTSRTSGDRKYLYDTVYKKEDLNNNYYADYVMIANNFITPKIYNMTSIRNTDYKNSDFKIWFKNYTGNPLPVLEIKSGSQTVIDEDTSVEVNSSTVDISQLVFKIECELIIA